MYKFWWANSPAVPRCTGAKVSARQAGVADPRKFRTTAITRGGERVRTPSPYKSVGTRTARMLFAGCSN